MKTKKIVNLQSSMELHSMELNSMELHSMELHSMELHSMELHSKFATRKWYIINGQNNGQYGRGN